MEAIEKLFKSGNVDNVCLALNFSLSKKSLTKSANNRLVEITRFSDKYIYVAVYDKNDLIATYNIVREEEAHEFIPDNNRRIKKTFLFNKLYEAFKEHDTDKLYYNSQEK